MAVKKDNNKKNTGSKKPIIVEYSEEIPEMVVDKEAYKEYLKIKNHELLNDKRIYNTSDVNLSIDLAQQLNYIKKKISHLSLEEQKDILAHTAAARALLGKLGYLKTKAFAQTSGRYLDDNTYLAPRITEVLELFGRFHTTEEVHRIINQDWGLEVSNSVVKQFREKHFEKINELQEKYKRDYSHVRLGYKRSRLDELSYLYQKRKEKIGTSVDNDKLMLMIMEQIRKEIDGDEIKINFEGKIDVNATINLHIQQDILQRVSIKTIVISRLCAKYGIESQLIMQRLYKSVYAKFAGTIPADGDLLEDAIIYPSQQIYDFNKIEKMNNRNKIEEAQIVEESRNKNTLSPAKEKTMSDLKRSLAEKLKQKQDQTSRVSRIDKKVE